MLGLRERYCQIMPTRLVVGEIDFRCFSESKIYEKTLKNLWRVVKLDYTTLNLKKAPRVSSKCLIWLEIFGGRCKFRTCDPCSVKGARATVPLQRCSNDTANWRKNQSCDGAKLANFDGWNYIINKWYALQAVDLNFRFDCLLRSRIYKAHHTAFFT